MRADIAHFSQSEIVVPCILSWGYPVIRRSPIKKRTTCRTWRCGGCSAHVDGHDKKCPTCGTRKATKRGNIGKRCDALWATYIKRSGKCFRCGAVEGLQAAHIIGRAQRVVRWSVEPPNGICLCHRCHRLFDTHRIDRDDLITWAIGWNEWVALVQKAQGVWDKQYPLAELTKLVKENSRD